MLDFLGKASPTGRRRGSRRPKLSLPDPTFVTKVPLSSSSVASLSSSSVVSPSSSVVSPSSSVESPSSSVDGLSFEFNVDFGDLLLLNYFL